MKRNLTKTIAFLTMITMGTTGPLANETRQLDSATGDWSCLIGQNAAGTLFVRDRSYVLTRPGVTMAGEYEQAAHRVMVINGPLLGLGVDAGTLVSASDTRQLQFPMRDGVLLVCREVL